MIEHEIADLQTAGVKHYIAGENQVAANLWARSMDMARRQADAEGYDDNVRYLCAESWTNGIGHIALLDFFAKRRILGLCHRRHIVLTRRTATANRSYLDLWRDHFEIVEHHAAYPPDVRLRQAVPMVLELDGRWMPFMEAVAAVERTWVAEGRPPLLVAPQSIVERGWDYLGTMGISRDAWFVTIHVRENGTVSGDASDLTSIRNAKLDDYALTVEETVKAGGQAIRIGKGRAERTIPGLVDLGGAPDWLDVFLLSQCRLFIGVNSGPAWVAGTFGTPALLTNWAPVSVRYEYVGARILPVILCRDGVPVELSHDDPLNFIESEARLNRMGVEVKRNDPGDIARAVSVKIQELMHL